MGRKKLPNILLADWDATRWSSGSWIITLFDIDMPNGHLYTFDVRSDEFFRYDVKGS